MDEFVNWDQADPVPAGAEVLSSTLLPSGESLQDLDLALANVDGDDFSFWALEHFENNVSPTLGADADIPMPTDRATRTFEDHLELPEAPCANCQLGGYQCKRIPEGEHRGYCTSCVALRCACSFGLGSGFPSNPWPLMGDHPEAIAQEDALIEPHHSISGADLAGSASASGTENKGTAAPPRAKVGARFSRESVKILKNWLSTHSKHPYPNDEEKEMLQKQTGLSKTQITNWLANTRRRNKNAVAHRSTSPGVRNWSNPIDIPQRRGTPSLEQMNPLQRWQHSPPEHEAASVSAIARAVNSASSLSSGLNSPYSLNFTDDGSGKSLCASTVSSANTSHSSTGSFASAYSLNSRNSFGSGGSLPRGRRRRRRKAQPVASTFRGPLKAFQCTFCTETFRTKHDWQRHEKSLHLSLERWVCSPDGPQAFNPENGQMSCVFCGHANPDEAHIDSHNHSACQERTVGERTFYRKDHLRQHLKLVHSARFTSWSMDSWRVTTPEIRSRCGFCDIIMDTWSFRVDHLAEHFKKGKSMADWKGDWGFDAPVLDMVENSIPPYLIHDERNSPDPFEASRTSSASARNAFELIKTELMVYIDDKREKEGRMPSDEELQRAACALIYSAEEASASSVASTSSWLRDLVLSSEPLAQEARWSRAGLVKGHQQQVKINGKGNIFEHDPMELELDVYVRARRLLGLTAMDSELQAEACNIIRRMEEASNYPSDEVVQFLMRLVNGSTKWLAGFRQRAHLPRSEDMADETKRSKDPTTIDSTIHNPSRLEFELAEYVREQRSRGIEPTDADLQRQARIIIYEYDDDDGWNQTAADDAVWLASFKQRHVSSALGAGAGSDEAQLPTIHRPADADAWCQMQQPQRSPTNSLSGAGSGSGPPKPRVLMFNDANCYNRLARELRKFVASTMSPNNPNCHVPSDEELQYQARWIIYEDDDPWNQTAADNAEWLRRFKRDVGILTDPAVPGLPSAATSWQISEGGSGFAPPYLCPKPDATGSATAPLVGHEPLNINNNNNSSSSSSNAGNDNSVLPGRAARNGNGEWPSVFCSRELEQELITWVEREVLVHGREFPADDEIRQRARDFLWRERTPADDAVLLGKFKAMMRDRLGLGLGLGLGFGLGLTVDTAANGDGEKEGATDNPVVGNEGVGLDGALSGQELDEMLQQMDFEFEELGGFMAGAGVDLGGMDMNQL
ncbi:Monocarboxylate transporter 4 [Madurella fahalii]|uniref:Monocarboxylate transporter 4 n=1 Tax=Madurella fahalii TaxID=1157608 RepID=A0ABQ0GM73_9PEZI